MNTVIITTPFFYKFIPLIIIAEKDFHFRQENSEKLKKKFSYTELNTGSCIPI
jgi:hypothetical protein